MRVKGVVVVEEEDTPENRIQTMKIIKDEKQMTNTTLP